MDNGHLPNIPLTQSHRTTRPHQEQAETETSKRGKKGAGLGEDGEDGKSGKNGKKGQSGKSGNADDDEYDEYGNRINKKYGEGGAEGDEFGDGDNEDLYERLTDESDRADEDTEKVFAGTADFTETIKSLMKSGDLSKSQELDFNENDENGGNYYNENDENGSRSNSRSGNPMLGMSGRQGNCSGSRLSQTGGSGANGSGGAGDESENAKLGMSGNLGGSGVGGSGSRAGSKLGQTGGSGAGGNGSRTGSRLSQTGGSGAGGSGSRSGSRAGGNGADGEGGEGADGQGKASNMINTLGSSLLGDAGADGSGAGGAGGSGSRAGSKLGQSGEDGADGTGGNGSRTCSRLSQNGGAGTDGADGSGSRAGSKLGQTGGSGAGGSGSRAGSRLSQTGGSGAGGTGSRAGSRASQAGANDDGTDGADGEGKASNLLNTKGSSLLGDAGADGKDGNGKDGVNGDGTDGANANGEGGDGSKTGTGAGAGEGDEEPQEVKHSRYAMGIDLGTTFCRYGVFHDDNIDTNGLDNVLQSAVVFDGDNRIVGVVPMSLEDDENAVVVTDFKRIIGRDFTDPSLPLFLENLPYKVVEDGETHRPAVEVPINGETKTFSAEQITAMLLAHVKELVSSQMGEEVTDAVISVPAFFTQAQRKATMDAGKIAGLNVIRIINEPTAAAVSFNAQQIAENAVKNGVDGENQDGEDEAKNVLVYDLGGGKLDVSILAVEGGDCTAIKTTGNTNLGGVDFDNRLVQLILKDFMDKTGLDPRDSHAAMRRLRVEAEKLKITLSEQDEADLHIPDFYGGKDLDFHITRAEFEDQCDDIFKQCLEPVEDIFADEELAIGDISKVLLVGGSSKIPRLRRMLRKFFGDDMEFFDVDQNEAVVEGAAMQGAIMKGQQDKKLRGVAIHGSVPLSLGISCANGKNMIIIPRGTTLPCKRFTQATTIRDKQRNVGFDIVEGERPMAADNIKLGHVTVSGIQIAKRGVPKIEVAMTITEDGILVVTGRDLMTHVAVTASVENKGTLPQAAVSKMIRQAAQEKFNDDLKMKRAERKTELVYFLERAEAAYNDESKTKKLKPADKAQYKQYVDEYKTWLEKHQDEIPSAYQRKYNTLYYALNKIMPVK
ncbi:hypothetical protein TRFO_07700 [Tritrichomonas foetus]|uniref:DnaK protein n=1 Tax=Tritrichomonas foetus TaxID=1144522 RepID=A0A1J4JPR1_9EUKA|nr:hypothetical protein TRFO_07700 [Tritrichomonas foetus]|eukprot:OHT01027.1 hypothetical protein TRFO_07700 [Tritrichomonas foetus]